MHHPLDDRATIDSLCEEGAPARPTGAARYQGRVPRLAISACLVSSVVAVASLGRRLSSPAPRVRSDLANGTTSLSESSLRPAYIKWAKHPEKCWEVSDHDKAHKHQPWNGMELVIMDCPASPRRFLLPVSGLGRIRMAEYPGYCLDALGRSTTLWFWPCDHAPKGNTMFVVPRGYRGSIRPTNNASKCIDVPQPTNGYRIMQWQCRENSLDQDFIIHRPVECKWGDWSDWSACSRVCKKTRTRKEFQDSKQKEDKRAGNQCDGKEQESRSCNVQHCGVETINFNGGAGPSGTLQGVKSGSRGRHQVSMTMFCFLFAVEHFLVR